MALVPLQSILEEAGISSKQSQETPAGLVDGTNTIFSVAYTPMSDTNYDDVVDEEDVLVLVNGAPAAISGIDTDKGIITLSNPPANGSEVLVTYRYSAANIDFLTQLRKEGMDWINRKAKKIDPEAPYDEGTDNPTVNAICRIYCAALILIRDYGFNTDTELTSKDGYYRMRLVRGDKNSKGMLQEFLDDGGICGESAAEASVDSIVAQSDGNLFSNCEPRRFNDDTGC